MVEESGGAHRGRLHQCRARCSSIHLEHESSQERSVACRATLVVVLEKSGSEGWSFCDARCRLALLIRFEEVRWQLGQYGCAYEESRQCCIRPLVELSYGQTRSFSFRGRVRMYV